MSTVSRIAPKTQKESSVLAKRFVSSKNRGGFPARRIWRAGPQRKHNFRTKNNHCEKSHNA